MHRDDTKYLYLPVETAAREFDGKLLLALYAVREGFEVVLASHAMLNAKVHQFPPGIYLSPSFNKPRAKIFKILKNLGFQIMAWDEEGLVWLNEQAYRTRRIHGPNIALLDTVFAWGDEHAALLRELDTKIVPIGNPRADLLSEKLRPLFAPKAEELKALYGDFILINSNFGWLNYALDSNNPDDNIEEKLKRLAEKSRHSIGYLKYRHAIFTAFCDLIPQLSKRFSDRQIIIRPHPSESPQAWQRATTGLENVMVKYDNDLVSWLMAAGTVLHNGCTTAVETAQLGKPVISYEPQRQEEFDSPQPRAVSTVATSARQVIDLIATSHKSLNGSKDKLSPMITGWGQRLSAPEIAAYMAETYDVTGHRAHGTQRLVGQFQSRRRQIEKHLKRSNPRSSSHPDYISQKFPPISASDIEVRARHMCDLTGLECPTISAVSDRIFKLVPRVAEK